MGGGSNNASREAEQAEAARRRQVEETQRQIEGIYTSPEREAQIQDVIGATRGFLETDLDRQQKKASRQSKFAAARSGQTMGSAAVTAQRELSDAYQRGLIEATRRAEAAGAGLRQQDQNSKLNLFAMAQAGLDATTAARQAGEAMRANIASSRADSMQTGIGDVFQSMGDLYKRSRERAGERNTELRMYNPYAGNPYYRPGAGYP
jgi:hypothetical protein